MTAKLFSEVPCAGVWPKRRARFLFHERRERYNVGDQQLTASQEYGVISQERYQSISGNRVTAALAGTENFLHVEKDDFVISLRTFEGGIERAHESGCISPAYTVMRPAKEVVPDFFQYSLKSQAFISTLQTTVTGIRDGKSVKYQNFADLVLPVPDRETQKAIADFLDRETARIDQLIEKKQRLVELVDEKRAAMITATVTGQIDPATGQPRPASVYKGGSGVNMIPLRHLATITNSNVDKVADPEESPVRLCNYVDVYNNDRIINDLDFMVASATPTEIAKFSLQVGDVIITKDSETPDDIAVPAYVSETAPDLLCGYHLTLLRARPQRIRGDFLFWTLQSKPVREAFSNSAKGVTRFGLTLDNIKSISLPCPNLDTQKAIADFLDRETVKLDRLKTLTNQSIDRLREYRSALITAAVTGQIDVASWGKRGETDRRLDKIQEATGV